MEAEHLFDTVSSADKAWDRQDIDYAESLYAKAAINAEKVYGPSSPLLETLLQRLLVVYETTGQFERSQNIMARLVALREHKDE